MWVFDGEEWVEEGGSSWSERANAAREIPMEIPMDELMPELQVIEIVPVRQPEKVIPFVTP